MCILIQHPAGTSFSNDWLADFYKKNSDGIGVMRSDGKKIMVHKLVPGKLNDLIKFYRKYVDKHECLVHLRFKTHGDVDIENCHPYQVFSKDDGYPLWLMHNGVLRTGNAADPTKSDTWHYIRDVIQPALRADPKQFMEPWFKTLVESHIGNNNKFAMMDGYGNVQIFNKSSGIMWGDVWMSNTYAWDAAKAGVIKTYVYPTYPTYNRGDDWAWGTTNKQLEKKPEVVHINAKKGRTQAELDAGDYAKRIAFALRNNNYSAAFHTIWQDELEEYFVTFGKEKCDELIAAINTKKLTNTEIIAMVDKVYDEPEVVEAKDATQTTPEVSDDEYAEWLAGEGRLPAGMS